MLAPVIIVLLLLLTGYTQYTSRQLSLSQASAVARGIAAEESATIQQQMVLARGNSETTAAAALALRAGGAADRESIKNLMHAALESQPSFAGVSACWLDFDGKNAESVNTENGNAKGRLGAYWSRGGSGLQYDQLQDFETQEYYTSPEKARQTVLTEPYIDDTSGVPVLMITVASPVVEKGAVVGVTTVDLGLDALSTLVKTIKPMGAGYAYVVTNKGMVVAHPDANYVAKSVTELPSVDQQTVMQSLREGRFFTQSGASAQDGSEILTSFLPFDLIPGQDPWYFAVALPTSVILQEADAQLYKTLLICLAGIILAVGAVVVVAGKIAAPMKSMAEHASLVAGGRYDNTLNTAGFSKELVDLYQSLEHMIASLVSTMNEANQSKGAAEDGLKRAQAAMQEAESAKEKALAGQKAILHAAENIEAVSARLGEAAAQLSDQVEQLSGSTERQRERISVSVSSMDEMSRTVYGVAQNAGDAAKGADVAKNEAQGGALIVKDSIAAIDTVQTNTGDLRREMDELGKQADAIGAIMNVISDIADQTNLLALNAAIEAARAGEAGRGFAVVADEVRKLAEKTMSATGEVGSAIRGIQERTQKSIQALTVTTANLENATELVNNSGTSLSAIVQETVRMSEQIADIAAAAEEQSVSSKEIGNSLTDVMSNAESVAAITRESAAAVVGLSRQAQELQTLVARLRSTV